MSFTPETLTAIGGVVGSLFTGLLSFLIGRRTAKNTEFDSLNKASAEFREEMRTDMRELKKEQDDSRKEISRLQGELSRATARIEALELIIKEKDKMIEALLKRP